MHERVMLAEGTGCVRLLNKVKNAYHGRVKEMSRIILDNYFYRGDSTNVRIEL